MMQTGGRDLPAQAVAATTAVAAREEAGGPPRAGAYRQRPAPQSEFRLCCDRGELPAALSHGTHGESPITWLADVRRLDYSFYLPLFLDGLSETQPPYCLLASQGTHDLLASPAASGRILPLLPQLVPPLRKALNTKIPKVMCTCMRVLQHLAQAEGGVGVALVASYGTLLPTLRQFGGSRATADTLYGVRRTDCVLRLAEETLGLLESLGGPDAFLGIKDVVPTYQSCRFRR